MDYLGNHVFPSLFTFILYPIDLAGIIEYTVGFLALFVSYKKQVEWVSTGITACIAYSLVLIVQKLVLHA
jgi:hypothetical protein